MVASFTDAWIETCIICRKRKANASHLLQMRGLKRNVSETGAAETASHLLQMRGLKREYISLTVPNISRIFYRCVD